MNELLKRDSGESLMQEVYKKLLNRLLNNELVPGNILNRKEIAEELEVSIAPVREALMKLTMEGFVETIPRKGTIVKAINREDIYGRFILREAIECQAARMYCGKKIQENYDQLLLYAEEVDSSMDDIAKTWQNDISFHQKLVELAECKVLDVEFKRIINVSTFYQINSFLSNAERQERLSHCELIEKLFIKDPEKAEKIIRDHLKSGKGNFF